MRLSPDIVQACVAYAPQASVELAGLLTVVQTETGNRPFEAADLDPSDGTEPLALLQDPAVLRQLLGEFAERTLRLQEENRALSIDLSCATAVLEHQEPIVEAYGRIVDADGTMCITYAAKHIGVRPFDLRAHMRDRSRKAGWIYGRPGIDEVAYQSRLQRRELVHKLVRVTRSSGAEEAVTQVRVTSRGLFLLNAEMLQRERDRRREAGEFDL